MLIASIDTGTTNSRVRIWRDGELLATASAAVGVRDTAIAGTKDPLKSGIRQAILNAAAMCEKAPNDLDLILASGMITSNLGLVEVPHVGAPAGLDELAAAMVATEVPDVAAQPIWFVPGVKNAIPADPLAGFDQIDFMRGEEVEALALAEQMPLPSGAIMVLPGSHNKLVEISPQRQILRCTTTLSGEMLASLTHHTVLASSLEGQHVRELDAPWLARGADLADRDGLTRAAFAVRVLTLMAKATSQQAANYLLGAVLADDLKALRAMASRGGNADLAVVLAGTSVVAAALAHLLRRDAAWGGRIHLVEPDSCRDLAGRGALMAAIRRGLIPSSFLP